jgi:uncharacterized membrane protein
MQNNLLTRAHPILRILISAVLAGLVCFLTKGASFTPLIRVMLLWDVFALSYCVMCWIIFFSRTANDIRREARKEDGSRTLVFVLIILACFASMLMVLLIILAADASSTATIIYLPIAIAGILFSWFMVHTVFAVHYAHLYYDDDEDNEQTHAAGLEFPEGKKAQPNYLDFAYFSFVIGMTFQVSDVEISRSKLRRVVLLHGLLSFGLNTFVVALTINLIAGLRQ